MMSLSPFSPQLQWTAGSYWSVDSNHLMKEIMNSGPINYSLTNRCVSVEQRGAGERGVWYRSQPRVGFYWTSAWQDSDRPPLTQGEVISGKAPRCPLSPMRQTSQRDAASASRFNLITPAPTCIE